MKKIRIWSSDLVIHATVDNEDFPLISKLRWRLGGKPGHPVALANIGSGDSKTSISMHRVVAAASLANYSDISLQQAVSNLGGMAVRHRDGDGMNNRRYNLQVKRGRGKARKKNIETPIENRVILDLCSGSGSWSEPYEEAGYSVVRIDLSKGKDVRFFKMPPKSLQIHGILAAPPCTHFSVSGARWWKGKGKEPLLDALSTVDACLRIILFSAPVWWALENPVGRLSRFLGPPTLTFDPCDFGDPWTKKTHLWGNFSVPHKNPVEATEGSIRDKHSRTRSRSKLRSITPPGFARAFFRTNP